MKLHIGDVPEFDDHGIVKRLYDEEAGLKGFIAIHRGGKKHPAFGATRLWPYKSEEEALRAALRLSRGMSYKAALAGLKYGGAKGVIIWNKHTSEQRKKMLTAYARAVNHLKGCFITGTDVGITVDDIQVMKKESPYFVGLRADPTYYTSLGILYAIQICLKRLFKTEALKGRTFAIRGVGKIGTALLDLIYNDADEIYIADIDTKRAKLVQSKYPKVNIVSHQDILKKPVDVFSPCALGLSLNKETVGGISAKIIAGGENNQLESSVIGEYLHKKGILYAPDYVVNAGGLISVIDEYEHKTDSKRRITWKIKRIKRRLKKILNASDRENKPTYAIANALAEKTFNRY